MNRWFVGIALAAGFVAAAGSFAAGAQPVPAPTVSPMTSASPTPMTTMNP